MGTLWLSLRSFQFHFILSMLWQNGGNNHFILQPNGVQESKCSQNHFKKKILHLKNVPKKVKNSDYIGNKLHYNTLSQVHIRVQHEKVIFSTDTDNTCKYFRIS